MNSTYTGTQTGTWSVRRLAIAIIAAGGMTILWQPQMNAAEKKSELTSTDKSFITSATQGGLAEVQAGEMAREKSKDPDVKAYGERLITDHKKANAELKELAGSKGMEVPTAPDMVQTAKLKLLGMKQGESFDKAFAEDAVTDHKSDIKAFEKAAKDLKDADLKAFAIKVLPTLKEHLSEAEKLVAKFTKGS